MSPENVVAFSSDCARDGPRADARTAFGSPTIADYTQDINLESRTPETRGHWREDDRRCPAAQSPHWRQHCLRPPRGQYLESCNQLLRGPDSGEHILNSRRLAARSYREHLMDRLEG